MTDVRDDPIARQHVSIATELSVTVATLFFLTAVVDASVLNTLAVAWTVVYVTWCLWWAGQYRVHVSGVEGIVVRER